MGRRIKYVPRRHRPKTKSSPRKGALIKGMSRLLPSVTLSDPVFKKKLKELMKGFAVIYALYKGEKLYYVGLTGNLHGRIGWHQKDRHAGRWNGFKIFRIKKIQYLKDIETLIHHLIKTKGNRVKGKVPKDANLNHVLREILKQHENTIRSIKRALK